MARIFLDHQRNPMALVRTERRPAPGDPRVIVALDFADMMSAFALASKLDPALCAVKIGKELFTSAETGLVRELVRRGFRVFLDLKFHDIPNTVAQACAAATRLGVWMVDVHAVGGSAMLKAARDAIAQAAVETNRPRPLLIAVTVLTSLTASDLAATGVSGTPEEQVLRLARLAQANGLDGVVCSAQEAAMLRSACGPDFTLVTPGIRPAGTAAHDQARIATPEGAVAAGADYLVIGRAIPQADDPRRALDAINAAIKGASS
jgi:orotidine-5'-phosphate decarboxylase